MRIREDSWIILVGFVVGVGVDVKVLSTNFHE